MFFVLIIPVIMDKHILCDSFNIQKGTNYAMLYPSSFWETLTEGYR